MYAVTSCLTQTTRLERTETRHQPQPGTVAGVSPKRLDLRELKLFGIPAAGGGSGGLTQTTRLERTETAVAAMPVAPASRLTQTTRLERTETCGAGSQVHVGDVSPKRLDLRELKLKGEAAERVLATGLTQTTRLERTETSQGLLAGGQAEVSPKRLDLRELKPSSGST